MRASGLADAPRAVRTQTQPDLRGLSTVNLVLICPSIGQKCGVARYTQYVAEALNSSVKTLQVISDSSSALRIAKDVDGECIVLLQHEYGLIDFNSSISGGETTSSVIQNLKNIQELGSSYRVGVVMHSIVLHDHVLTALNKQWFSSGIPLFSLSREGAAAACVNYVEHGTRLSDKPCRAPAEFRIGAFGLLSANKDVESVLQLCVATQSPIHANYACRDLHAIDRVSDRMRELGVEGKIRFDFLPEQELLQFLQESSVIYLPQHDFEHYATSGSARFALSARRAVITPPHRAFHDLAGGVYFADLTGAIDEVRRLKCSEPRMRFHLAAGERYLWTSNLLTLYSDLLRRLRADDVWTGGSWNPYLPPKHLTEADLDMVLVATGHLAPQESACFRRNGIGMLRGDFLRTIPDQVVLPDGDADLADLPAAPSTCAALDDATVQPESGLSCLGMQSLLSEHAPVSRHLEVGSIEAFLRASLADARKTKTIVRLVRSPGSYLPAIVFFQYPLHFQILILLLEFGIPINDIIDYIPRNHGLAAEHFLRLEIELPLVSSSIALRSLCLCYPSLAGQIVWAQVPFPGRHERNEVIFPASLMAFESEMFIVSLYRVILHREPDVQGFRHHVDALKQGISKAMLAHGMVQTDEARRCGTRLHGDLRYWQEVEVQIVDDLARCAAFASAGDRLLCDNLSYAARNSNGALLEWLRLS